MQPLSVAVVQCGPGGVDLQWLAGALVGNRADLVVLPELADGPYFPLEPSTDEAAEPQRLEGEFIDALRALARDQRSHMLTGLHLEEGGIRTNAAVLVGPDGQLVAGRDLAGTERLSYSKVQLCDITTRSADFRESQYFTAGEHHVVWDTPLGRVGCLICYDRHFPEAWRLLRQAGIELVAVPVASAEASREWFVAEMQAMALQQTVYVAVANRAGVERLEASGTTTVYAGLSCVIRPDGSVAAQAPFAEPNTIVRATVDPRLLERLRREHPFAEDVRRDVYSREQGSLQAGTAPRT